MKPSHKTFYVDPVKGSKDGDGSASKPWRTLSEVVAQGSKLISTKGHGNGFVRGYDTAWHDINPKGPVKSGDVILLMSGDHGSPDLANMFNDDFITVAAAPGQTPVIHLLSLRSASKWVFRGIKIQDTFASNLDSNKNPGLVRLGWGEFLGSSSDIVLDGNTISSFDQTGDINDPKWVRQLYGYAFWSVTSCTSFTNNHISNIQNGSFALGEKGLYEGNTVENFVTDGLDLVASNLIVRKNIIRNNISTSNNQAHPDGIQGWTKGNNINRNVVIDSNVITNKAAANGSWMQGITIFDGKWDGVKVINNVVVTNAWDGIILCGVDNAVVMNNTVMTTDPKTPIWIMIVGAKNGIYAKNALVRNNIAPQLRLYANGWTADHNLLAQYASIPAPGAKDAGKAISSGTIGNANKIVPSIMSNFYAVDTKTGSYDLRLKTSSPAIGAGSPLLAPATDVTGRPRATPIDVGAYTH